jgi:hypothetical protein
MKNGNIEQAFNDRDVKKKEYEGIVIELDEEHEEKMNNLIKNPILILIKIMEAGYNTTRSILKLLSIHFI